MKQANNARGWKKGLRGGWLPLLIIIPVLLVAWAGYAGYVSEHGMPMAEQDGWSGQVLSTLHEGIVAGSPIPVANACGLGASSCFKCHNGKRAGEPGEGIWHDDHADVNHSCVGCHDGNERLMLERMAHKDLLANPLDKAEEMCGDCHTDDDAGAMIEKYQEAVAAKSTEEAEKMTEGAANE